MNTSFINVLISSVSKKVPLVKSVRKALDRLNIEGKIIGADADPECIASYFVDQFWKMPLLSEITPEEYIAYCQFYHVNRVIPTRDGELPFYAKYRNAFAQQGIHVMVSGEEGINICLDKLQFYGQLSSLGYPVIETCHSIEELECESYVVKEQFGAGSRTIGLNLSKNEASKHAKKMNNPIFQPYINGKEISADLYVDRSGKTKGVILRSRDRIVEGESQVTTTFRNETLEQVCSKMAEDLSLYGHVMFQFIYSSQNEIFYVLEANPRFGGASPLSLEMGLDSFFWFFLEVIGEDLSNYPFIRPDVEKRLIRHAEDLII